MAKSAWCAVAPMTGKENAPINITLPVHTGRAARSTTVTVANKNGTKPNKVITVNQTGAVVFLNMDASKPDVPKTGGTVTINGTSNSDFLFWNTKIFVNGAQLGDSIESAGIAGFSSVIKVDDNPLNNGSDVGLGLGVNVQYAFVATLVIPASPFPIDVELRFSVEDKDRDITKVCKMTWKAGASTISVDKTSLSFPASGGTQTVNITSNDEWSVS